MIALAAVCVAGCGKGGEGAATFQAPVVIPHAPVAPDFTLHDSAGRAVRLSDFRGHPVLLTFIYVHCPDVCPLIVGKLRAALLRLRDTAAPARVVAVSVDPRGDTPRAVRAFVRQRGMAGRMIYLVGSHAELAKVWRVYGIGVAASPEERETGHSALVYGISASGRRQVLYPQDFTVAAVVHDVPALAAR